MLRGIAFVVFLALQPLVLPPDAPPKIMGFALSATVVHAGDIVHGHVITSSNVASVEVRVANYYSVNMNKVGVGRFTVRVVVPSLPPILHRTYGVAIIARNTKGVRTEQKTSITIE